VLRAIIPRFPLSVFTLIWVNPTALSQIWAPQYLPTFQRVKQREGIEGEGARRAVKGGEHC